MFENIDWETYFPVKILNLDKNLHLTVKLNQPLADKKRKEIFFAILDWEKANDKMENVEIINENDSTITVNSNLKNNMAEDMGYILPLFNSVENISEIIVGNEEENRL